MKAYCCFGAVERQDVPLNGLAASGTSYKKLFDRSGRMIELYS